MRESPFFGRVRFTAFLLIVCMLCAALSGCGGPELIASTSAPSDVDEGWTAVINAPSVYASYTADTRTITGISSKNAILIDTQNNEVIASLNGEERIYPASMTKMMTLIVAADKILDPAHTTYTFRAEILDPPYLAGASCAGFKNGETVSFLDIFYGVALPSGADATGAIADYISGSEEAFAELMNEKAEQIGLCNTHFVTASGLHAPDHYSTPHDMAILMEYIMNHPTLAPIFSTYQYRTAATAQNPDGILLVSTLFSKMEGGEPETCRVIAGKTGYTPEAQNCLASCAETPDGHRYVLVTAGGADGTSYAAIFDAIRIYKEYIPADS